MSSNAKIGLLLGLVIVFLIVFIIKGFSGVDNAGNDYQSPIAIENPPGIKPYITPEVFPLRRVSARHPEEPPPPEDKERFQVKRITVNPGQILSLQMHHHRAEHWIVVKGTAKVTRGEEQFLLSENESTYIPIGTKHRLENPGMIPLELIVKQHLPVEFTVFALLVQ